MFDDRVDVDPPVKLRELITDGWIFPIDYPVVNNNNSPDASRTLRAAIAYSVIQHYKDHRICSYDVNYFTERLASRLYDKMSQHQYWIDEYLNLIDDGQFFYNDEWQDGGTHTVTSSTSTNGRTTTSTNNNTSKSSDTPQNYIGDINNYLSNAQVDNGGESGTESGNGSSNDETNFTTDLHIKKSTLGDITHQFQRFADFPNFIKQITDAVAPCFIMYYGNEDV